MRIEGFELVTDTREISIYGAGFDMVTHENGEKTKGIGCRVNWEIVRTAESYVRLKSRGVRGCR